MAAARMDSAHDRAQGALLGVALGDALGMPSQTLSRGEIRARYGRIEGFLPPFDGHPVSHGLSAAMVTDDTEQTFLLADRLLASPDVFDGAAWVRDLLEWETGVLSRGLRDILGPSTKAALEAVGRGVPVEDASRGGTTNGAAMRIAPVGIATPPRDLRRLVDAVEQACRVTHNTGEAIAAASAVAAVVSAGLDGASFEDSLPLALTAAAEGQRRGHPAGERDMAGCIAAALEVARRSASPDALADAVGTSVASRESIPAAFGLVLMAGADAWSAALMAANIGDDTDTIGAIAGAMAGACQGAAALPADAVALLRSVNSLPVERVAGGLLELRRRGPTS